jgi:serine/threonine-protein kinase
MPDVSGMSETDAITALTNAKLVLGAITQSDSPTVAKNMVISSDPAANTQVPAGTVVNLVVSTGSVLIPDVVGLDLSDARSKLTAPQVGYMVETELDPSCEGVEGTVVIRQRFLEYQQRSDRSDLWLLQLRTLPRISNLHRKVGL